MEFDAAHWAHDAFLALSDVDGHSPTDKWPAFSASSPSFRPAAFTLPPSLISQASIERFGQITPPDELSPTAPKPDACREHSVPVEHLQNDVPWPMQQQIQSLANFEPEHPQPPPPPQPEPKSQSQSQESATRSSKRRRTSKTTSANHKECNSTPQEDQAAPNPQSPKRKRGRPKSQLQTVEAYTTEGYPFHVSSARQSHLEKNRVAAHKCRQRKKEYIGGLEARAREYSATNKALKESVAILREEVLQLKNEVLRHAGCNFWAVDEYLARCAGDLLGMENPTLGSKTSSKTTPTLPSLGIAKERKMSADSELAPGSSPSEEEQGIEDYHGLDLLNDFDDSMDDEPVHRLIT